jgi:MYND finger
MAHPSEYGELFRRCNHCKTAEGPFQVCSNCKVALYCSREHQAAEWPHHKTVCNTIARTRRKVEVEVEEQTLREEEADFISPGNVENAVGDFWGFTGRATTCAHVSPTLMPCGRCTTSGLFKHSTTTSWKPYESVTVIGWGCAT